MALKNSSLQHERGSCGILTQTRKTLGISSFGLKYRDQEFKYIPMEPKIYGPFVKLIALSYFIFKRKEKKSLLIT